MKRLVGLLLDSRDNLGVAVPDPDHAGRLRQHVDVLFAVGIPELGALPLHNVNGNVAPTVRQELLVTFDRVLR